MFEKLRKFDTLSPAAKASIALLFANLVLKGLSMISGPIFTRLMPASEYGMVSTFMSWQSMLSTIVTLNLGAGVFNNGMLEYKQDRDRFQFSLVFISTATALLFLAIYKIFEQQMQQLLELPSNLVYLLVAYFIFVPVYGYWSGRQRYEFKYKLLTLITIGVAVVSLLVSILAVLFIPSSHVSEVKIFASEMPHVILGLIFFVYIGYKAKFKAKLSYILYALKFNLPLIPHYLSMYVLASSDRIMITKLVNTVATAVYSVSYTVGMVINIVWQSIEASLSPWIYENLDHENYKDVRKRTFQILLIFVGACVLCALFAPEIIWVLAPKEYYEGIYIIPSISASAFFIAAYSIYMRIELYYKQTTFAMIATSISAIANLALNFIFIRMFGYIAAGYTTLACYVLLYILHYLNVKSKGFDNCLDNRSIAMLALVVIIFSFALNFVYAYTAFRYIIIVFLMIISVIKRNTLIAIINKREIRKES